MSKFFLILEAIREENIRRRRRQTMREILNYRTIPDGEFIRNYRLSKSVFEDICKDIVPLLPLKKNRYGVDPIMKVLTALNFFARGSYQWCVGNNCDAPMAQQTVSRCIREVTTALNEPHIVAKYIKFPQTREDRTRIKSRFYNKYGFPGVCGCIDCTHIAIIKPTNNEERFYNRKSYHSLDVQVICDADNYILNVDASYGGATHDSFIWSESQIKEHLENITEQGEVAFLLGDSGYPLRPYLITPFGDAADDTAEGRFNYLQKKTRATVERTFGILKGRFRCLLSAPEMHLCPETAGKITIACCVLHNICIRDVIEFPELSEVEMLHELQSQPTSLLGAPALSATQALRRGQSVRANLVNQLVSERPT